MVIAIGGPAGSGKSTLASRCATWLGPNLPAAWISSDAIRKEMAGVALDQRLPDAAYAPNLKADVYNEMWRRSRVHISQHRSVILDASFRTRAERDRASQAAHEIDVPLLGLILQLGRGTRAMRIRSRVGDPSDADEAFVMRHETFEALAPDEGDWTVLDAGVPSETMEAALKKLIVGTLG